MRKLRQNIIPSTLTAFPTHAFQRLQILRCLLGSFQREIPSFPLQYDIGYSIDTVPCLLAYQHLRLLQPFMFVFHEGFSFAFGNSGCSGGCYECRWGRRVGRSSEVLFVERYGIELVEDNQLTLESFVRMQVKVKGG